MASCCADETGAVCWELDSSELFPLGKEADPSPALQLLLEGCATAENGSSILLRTLPRWGLLYLSWRFWGGEGGRREEFGVVFFLLLFS